MSSESRAHTGTRRRGRVDYDSSRRDRILHTAMEQFADKGFAAVRIDEIAASAGANKQLIYYYFQSKSDLYESVLEHMVEETSKMWDFLETAPSLEAALWRLSDWSEFSAVWRRLLAWEGLEYGSGDGTIRLEAARTASWSRWVAIVRRAQERGEISADLDHEMFALLLISMSGITTSLPQVAKMVVTHAEPDSKEFQQRYLELITTMVKSVSPERR
ncbi:TetR/AcrR family transcriptional regulator [Rhodococcus sp. NCIMB 12038]|uniref:TetR/AcrR family transcriptional regulator n=1 Tax=Rhodococcus sp. NCIMB 12038 TaxID=933800 RepID=UPI000B3D3065|nr:TetR/AcrR family transcriptional regulator [Rhodococcus sp. NCIMB 12038]OUS93962.1 hypothetical protein CA951_21395 [Rhodococcus sp. NCIMB 12038]